jgi:hypothetical protein
MCVNNKSDAFARERFFSETSFDIIQHLSVRGVRFIQNVLEMEIRGTQAVAEVLGENPTTIYSIISSIRVSKNAGHTGIGRLLHSMSGMNGVEEKGVVWQAIQ